MVVVKKPKPLHPRQQRHARPALPSADALPLHDHLRPRLLHPHQVPAEQPFPHQQSSRFPISPWDNLASQDATLQLFNGKQPNQQWNVQQLWAWSRCDQYITTGRMPSQTGKYSLAYVSPSHPVFMPVGCNCLAQVGHAVPSNWTYGQSASPTTGT
eukprot:765676-Hanusia_phi.AAC.2